MHRNEKRHHWQEGVVIEPAGPTAPSSLRREVKSPQRTGWPRVGRSHPLRDPPPPIRPINETNEILAPVHRWSLCFAVLVNSGGTA